MRLFSYKLKHDSGFAPNPFFGVLTLATCKPRIRKSKNKGDWIAGFTSRSLCGDAVGKERLIYLMQITDKIPISEYFPHPNFQNKIPDLSREEIVYHAGDNIYELQSDDYYRWIENKNHPEEEKNKDLSGEFVLISTKFYYFGGNPLEIPSDLRPRVPFGQSAHGSLTQGEQASKFINYVRDGISEGVHHAPHRWPDSDLSWRM